MSKVDNLVEIYEEIFEDSIEVCKGPLKEIIFSFVP